MTDPIAQLENYITRYEMRVHGYNFGGEMLPTIKQAKNLLKQPTHTKSELEKIAELNRTFEQDTIAAQTFTGEHRKDFISLAQTVHNSLGAEEYSHLLKPLRMRVGARIKFIKKEGLVHLDDFVLIESAITVLKANKQDIKEIEPQYNALYNHYRKPKRKP